MKTLCLLALVSLQAVYHGGQNVPEIAVAEIHRRGDAVEHVTPRAFGADQSQPLEALAPPEDDSHKWYITVITQRGCAPCDLLKHDFARAPELAAFVNVADHTASWAHYNVYALEDQTQKWRWQKIRIARTPTVIIQPPRDGRYGDPKTVVWQQSGYSGDPAQLAQKIRAAIVSYAQRRQETRDKRQEPEAPSSSPALDSRPSTLDSSGFGQPFTPPEPNDLVPTIDWPRPLQPRPDPAPAPVAPDAQPAAPKIDLGTLVTMLIGSLLTGNNVALFAIAGVGGFMLIRKIRQARGKPMILSDETVDALAGRIFDLLGIDDDDEPKATVKKAAPRKRVLRRKRRS